MTMPMAVEPIRRKAPARRLAAAWTILVTVTVALRALRFQRIEHVARQFSRWTTQNATVHEVADLLALIDQASRWLPARVACLERSLAVVLWCGLRRRSVCWRLGVRTPPFAAHAWIEIAGRPISEPVPVHTYLPILSIDTSPQEHNCPSPPSSSPTPQPHSTTRAMSASLMGRH